MHYHHRSMPQFVVDIIRLKRGLFLPLLRDRNLIVFLVLAMECLLRILLLLHTRHLCRSMVFAFLAMAF